MKRRGFLCILPASGAALAVPTLQKADPFEEYRREMISVIESLEVRHDWEPSSVAAAKSFAAYKMRKAMGLGIPDPKLAQMHVNSQKRKFVEYQGTVMGQRDREAGKAYPFMEMLA